MLFASWRDIYRTDGTAEGTHHLAGIPGMDNQAFITAQPLAGRVLFRNRYEVWVSDGTSDDTLELAEPGQVNSILAHQGQLYFAGDELWATDGTPTGTRMIKDLFAGPNPSHIRHMQRAGSQVVFAADAGRFGYELYVSDGTEAGTRLLKDVTEGVEGTPIDVPDWLMSPGFDNGLAYFVVDREREGDDYALWRSDGTEAGTFALKTDFHRGRGMGSARRLPYGMISHQGLTYFLVEGRPTELWQTDGTLEGTQPVPVTFGSAPSWIASLGDHLYAVVGTSLVRVL